jgi:hypothetical protein
MLNEYEGSSDHIAMQLQNFFFGAIKLMVKHESTVSLLQPTLARNYTGNFK